MKTKTVKYCYLLILLLIASWLNGNTYDDMIREHARLFATASILYEDDYDLQKIIAANIKLEERLSSLDRMQILAIENSGYNFHFDLFVLRFRIVNLYMHAGEEENSRRFLMKIEESSNDPRFDIAVNSFSKYDRMIIFFNQWRRFDSVRPSWEDPDSDLKILNSLIKEFPRIEQRQGKEEKHPKAR